MRNSLHHWRHRPRARAGLALTLAAAIVAVLVATAPPAPTRAAACPALDAIRVSGADKQEAFCLDDLTTAGLVANTHTDPRDWAGLHAKDTRNPSGIPGIQINGYFPDDSTSNTLHGWNHDAQFVLRLPDTWNGKLVITGAPGVRRQYANDVIISDWVVARGYAYASTDKGNGGGSFFRDGAEPGDAIAEWHRRVTELTIAAKDVVRQRYGHEPERTYMTGVSNGGYLTRWAIENRPDLYDGAVDWEGTLFRPEQSNLFTYLPTALKHYPAFRDRRDLAARDAMIAVGFAPGSEFLWEFHYQVYWDATQRIYREELDPTYDGEAEAGTAFCAPGTPACDADYDYTARPRAVRDAVAKVSLTGDIRKPMITLHGTLDTLLPITTDSDIYAELVGRAGRTDMHRYYVVEQGTHVDSLYDQFPDRLRPILPCYRAAFEALERWVESGGSAAPPSSSFLARPSGGEVVNECSL